MLSRVGIVGAGEVGASVAYTLILGNVCGEILLVDIKSKFRDGQVRDLSDAVYCTNSSTRVRAATLKEVGQCDVVVIAIGARHRIGESRLELTFRHTANVRGAIESIKPLRHDSVLLVVSTPNDVLTTIAQQISGLPKAQVIGIGTYLATFRLRRLLSTKLGLGPDTTKAFVLGESVDEQFVAWSTTKVGDDALDDTLSLQTTGCVGLAEEIRSEALRIADQAKDEGQRIYEAKHMIVFGIAAATASICSSILLDERSICPVSHWQPELECCLSMPAIVGRPGVVETVKPHLIIKEQSLLDRAAELLRAEVRSLVEDN